MEVGDTVGTDFQVLSDLRSDRCISLGIEEHCPGGAREVSYYAGPIDLFVSTITLGIVGMRTVNIDCAHPRSAAPTAGGAR